MKNIFYVFLLMPLFYLSAQDEGPYLIRLHVVEVEGNIGAFIQANREYYKPLAAKAVEDGKWAGWSMRVGQLHTQVDLFFSIIFQAQNSMLHQRAYGEQVKQKNWV